MKGMAKKWMWTIGVSMILCIMAWPAAASDGVRLGLITPLTGALSFGGNEVKNGVTLAVEHKKTLFGKPIRMVVGNAPDSTAAVAEMERLITREKLNVIFGGYGSSIEEAYQKVAERHKVLNLGLVNWSDKLNQSGLKYYYRWTPPVKKFSATLGDVAVMLAQKYLKKGPEQVRIGVVNSDLTGYVAAPILESLKGNGVKHVYHESYPADLKNFTPLLLKVKQKNLDILIVAQYTADGLAFRRQMYSMDYEPPIMLGAGLIYDQPEFAGLGPAADGALALSYTNPEMNPKVAPGVQEFKREYAERFNHPPLTHALQAYAGALVFMGVIESVGSLDVEKIRAALNVTNIPPGLTPAYWGCKFDETNLNERAGVPFVLAQWKKGKYVVVWPEAFATQKLELPLKPFSNR